MSLNIDVPAFKRRVSALQRALDDPKLEDSKAWVTVLGKGDDDTRNQLASTLHLWLLGVPFANTCIIVSKEKTVLIAAGKQTKHLESLQSASVEVLTRGKEPEECTKLLTEVLDNTLAIPKDAKLAIFGKDKPASPIAVAFREAYEARPAATVDGSSLFSALLQIKDEGERRAVRMAAKTAAGLTTEFALDRIMSILDEGKKVPNSELAAAIEKSIDNTKLLQRLRIGSEFNASELDWTVPPQVNDNRPGDVGEKSVIQVALSSSYHSYNASVVRTYLVNATNTQTTTYQALYGAQREAIRAAVAGATAQDVWKAVQAHVEAKNSDLLPFLVSPVGYGTGLQHEDLALALKEGNATPLAEDQTLVISIELRDVSTDSSIEPFSLKLADTIRVTSAEPIVFSEVPKTLKEVAFQLEDDDAKQDKVKSDATQPRNARQPRAARGGDKREVSESAERAMEEHQRELKARLQDQGVQKYANTEDSEIADAGPVFRKFEAYKREAQLPKIESLRISIDSRAHSIVLPVSGRPVPFHINTFRSGSATEEGQYVYLRLNFNSPDSMMAKRDDVPYDNPNAHFLKSITLRSRDSERMRETLKKIQDLKKESTRREKEREQLADVVQQDKLVEARDKRPLRLEPVFVRPMPEGKRVPGVLEIHKNGVRYSSPIREQVVDVLFSNVEHLFYQPNDHEVITLIHFHLKNHIMIGKRKTKDVQFYRDATDMTADDTGHRKRRYRYGDEDELEQEEQERKLRVKLNREFFQYAERISAASDGQLDVDTPFRELGFNGVPFRANMYLQPTTNCLVQLSETPFYVITLSEVELAVLERVRFGLKQFDLVFVFKDYKRAVSQINSIPMTQLDSVKSWLNEVDIPFFDADLNFNWKEVMNTINSSPHQFFVEDGGWSFLEPEAAVGSGAEEIEDDSDVPGEEEFSVSDASPDDESEDFGEDSGSGDDSEGSFEDESEEEGADWSDLEEEAKREDRRKEKSETN